MSKQESKFFRHRAFSLPTPPVEMKSEAGKTSGVCNLGGDQVVCISIVKRYHSSVRNPVV